MAWLYTLDGGTILFNRFGKEVEPTATVVARQTDSVNDLGR